jgi:hypothetical protein
MLPRVLTSVDPESERAKYKIVRADSMTDVSPDSLILSASVESGLCLLRHLSGTTQEFAFNENGLIICTRK